MKIIHVTPASFGADLPAALSALLSDLTDAKVVFSPETYFLDRPVEVKNAENVTLDGNGCTFLLRFDRCTYAEEGVSTDGFRFADCGRVTFKNFTVRCDEPVSAAGVALSSTDETIDIEFHSALPLTGKENFLVVRDLKDHPPVWGAWHRRPDLDPNRRVVIAGEVVTTNPPILDMKKEWLGGNRWRVWCSAPRNVEPGLPVVLLHAYYGTAAFAFRGCSDFLFENVTIPCIGGMGFVILPRCRDFTFRRLRVVTDDPVRVPVCTGADTIHTLGIGGKLVVEDSYFEASSDDPLNLHTQFLVAKSADGQTAHLVYDKLYGVVSPRWAEKGDTLRVFDPKTWQERCRVTVESAPAGNGDAGVDVTVSGGVIRPGDLVTNAAYYADLVVRNNVFVNKLRALVVQAADSALIENNRFVNVGRCVYVSAAFEKWYEAGPAQNVVIRNNVSQGAFRDSAVFVRTVGSLEGKAGHIHRNISITGNRFVGSKADALITVQSTDGLVVRGNTAKDCKNRAVSVAECTDAEVEPVTEE